MTFFLKENHPLCISPIRGRLGCFFMLSDSEKFNFLKLDEFIHPLCFSPIQGEIGLFFLC